MPKVNLEEGLRQFADLWRPKIIADLNDYKVQLVKVQGEWVWHNHDDTDELFLVIAGRLTMQMRDGDVELGPSDLLDRAQRRRTLPDGLRDVPPPADRHVANLYTTPGDANLERGGGLRSECLTRASS